METHLENDILSRKKYFVDDFYSIADIALFAYTYVSEDGEFDLSKYKNILAWIERIKSHKYHIELI